MLTHTGITLPMRDWDHIKIYSIYCCHCGLHYLWGIETISKPLLEGSKSVWITLPMRDWDVSTESVSVESHNSMDYITYEGLRRLFHSLPNLHNVWITLPMRDWDRCEVINSRFTTVKRITLPMRDWDLHDMYVTSPLFKRITLPMRDWDIITYFSWSNIFT